MKNKKFKKAMTKVKSVTKSGAKTIGKGAVSGVALGCCAAIATVEVARTILLTPPTLTLVACGRSLDILENV